MRIRYAARPSLTESAGERRDPTGDDEWHDAGGPETKISC